MHRILLRRFSGTCFFNGSHPTWFGSHLLYAWARRNLLLQKVDVWPCIRKEKVPKRRGLRGDGEVKCHPKVPRPPRCSDLLQPHITPESQARGKLALTKSRYSKIRFAEAGTSSGIWTGA